MSEEAPVRIVVNRDLCEANAVCQKNAPGIFKVDESDVLHILVERPSPEQMEKVELAVRRCPRKALSLVED